MNAPQYPYSISRISNNVPFHLFLVCILTTFRVTSFPTPSSLLLPWPIMIMIILLFLLLDLLFNNNQVADDTNSLRIFPSASFIHNKCFVRHNVSKTGQIYYHYCTISETNPTVVKVMKQMYPALTRSYPSRAKKRAIPKDWKQTNLPSW